MAIRLTDIQEPQTNLPKPLRLTEIDEIPAETPLQAGERAGKAFDTASQTDVLDDYDKQVMFFYNWMKSPGKFQEKKPIDIALSRFANPLGLRRWLSRKFGSGEEAAWFDALDAYYSELPWSNPEKALHFGVGAYQKLAEFEAVGATAGSMSLGIKGALGKIIGGGLKFGTVAAIQAPGEKETLAGRAEDISINSLYGMAFGGLSEARIAGRQPFRLFRYRAPVTVGGSMLVTAAGGGTAKQILDSGAQMLGWEAIGLIQQGANKWAAIAAARRFNPELNKVPADEIERGVRQMADIQKAVTESEKATEKPAGAKAVETAKVGKKSWEMTKEEFKIWMGSRWKETGGVGELDLSISGPDAHRETIKRALARGEIVPSEVLAEYPDLAKQAPVEPGAKATGKLAPEQSQQVIEYNRAVTKWIEEGRKPGEKPIAPIFEKPAEPEARAPEPVQMPSEKTPVPPVVETKSLEGPLPEPGESAKTFTGVTRPMLHRLVITGQEMLEKGQIDFESFQKQATDILQSRGESNKFYLIGPAWEEANKAYRQSHGLPEPESPIPNYDKTIQNLRSKVPTMFAVGRAEADKLIKEMHKRQAARGTGMLRSALKKGRSVWQSIDISEKAYKDTAGIPAVTPMNFSDMELESLGRKILELYPAEDVRLQFQRTATKSAIAKLHEGIQLTNYDYKMLVPVLGQDIVEDIFRQQSKLVSPSEKKWQFLNNFAGLWKALKLGTDVQYGRNVSTITARHPLEVVVGEGIALKAYTNAEYSRLVDRELRLDPYFEENSKYLRLLSREPWAAEAERPEQYPAIQLPEKLAKFGKNLPEPLRTLTMPVRAVGRLNIYAERAFVSSIDWTMNNLLNTYRSELMQQKLSAEEMVPLLESRGNTINSFVKLLKARSPTGRAVMKVSNLIMTSPSMTFGRFAQIKSALANPGSRIYAIGALTTNIAKIMLFSQLVKMTWRHFHPDDDEERPYVDSEVNPLSPTWGQIRVGNSYGDPHGGDAQFYRTLSRFITGRYVDSMGVMREIPRWEVLTRYAMTRESPIIQWGKEVLTGKDWLGNPIYTAPEWIETTGGKIVYIGSKELLKLVSPSTADSIYEAAVADGIPHALVAGVFSILSVGVSSYPISMSHQLQLAEDKLAQKTYSKQWENLSPRQQDELLPQLDDLVLKAAQERIARREEVYTTPEEIAKVSKRITESLPKKIQKELFELAIPAGGLSRKWGDFYLSDKRYARYEELTKTEMKKSLTEFFADLPSDWQEWNQKSKARRLQRIIALAKRRAHNQLLREINADEI